MSMRAFAAEHGIHHKRLERWSARLRQRTREVGEAPVQFLPLALAAQVSTSPVAAADPGLDVMEVRLPSGMSINVRPGFDGPALRRLLEALGC
jgi:hypothetical protein